MAQSKKQRRKDNCLGLGAGQITHRLFPILRVLRQPLENTLRETILNFLIATRD